MRARGGRPGGRDTRERSTPWRLSGNAPAVGIAGEGREVRALGHQADDDVLRVGNLEIDRLRRQVRRAGRPVELTAREFDVLALLAQWRGQPVSRDLLAREVWKVNRRLTPLDNVIDVHLSHLREKIDGGHDSKLIWTVRGVGFRLAEDGA